MKKIHFLFLSLFIMIAGTLQAQITPLTYSLGEIQSTSLEMNFSNQPAGIYLIEIEVDGNSLLEKLRVN